MTKIWFRPRVLGREDMKKILRPLADQAGVLLHHVLAGSAASFGVRFICSFPSAVIRNTEQYPSRKLMKAMYLPSPDDAGIWAKLGAVSCVSRTGMPVPSALIVAISMPRRKRICLPS